MRETIALSRADGHGRTCRFVVKDPHKRFPGNKPLLRDLFDHLKAMGLELEAQLEITATELLGEPSKWTSDIEIWRNEKRVDTNINPSGYLSTCRPTDGDYFTLVPLSNSVKVTRFRIISPPDHAQPFLDLRTTIEFPIATMVASACLKLDFPTWVADQVIVIFPTPALDRYR